MPNLVDNTVILTIYRLAIIAMPLIFGAAIWLFPQWLDNRFAERTELATLSTRVSVIESRLVAQDTFQDKTITRLDDLRSQVSALSRQVAVINSKLNSNEAFSGRIPQSVSPTVSPEPSRQ